MIDRRAFVQAVVFTLVGAPPEVGAQMTKTARIGTLHPGASSTNSGFLEALRQGLRELGYVEGQNIIFEPRYAEGRADRFADLAAEVVRLRADVIVVAGPMIEAALQATDTIPIVMSAASDPVAEGFVGSLARPGKNVTGLSIASQELDGKRAQLLKEALPKATRIALLWNAGTSRVHIQATQIAAHALGLQFELLEARNPEMIDRAFATAVKRRVSALVVGAGALGLQHRQRIIDLAARHRVPALYLFRDFVEAGGLMSYGANLVERWHRAAIYVDRILKGAKPADLPIEQPTKFELIINMKTAKALGITIPPSLLLRADRVIE